MHGLLCTCISSEVYVFVFIPSSAQIVEFGCQSAFSFNPYVKEDYIWVEGICVRKVLT